MTFWPLFITEIHHAFPFGTPLVPGDRILRTETHPRFIPRNPVGSWWPYPENRTLGSSLGTPLVPGDRIRRTAPSVLPSEPRWFLVTVSWPHLRTLLILPSVDSYNLRIPAVCLSVNWLNSCHLRIPASAESRWRLLDSCIPRIPNFCYLCWFSAIRGFLHPQIPTVVVVGCPHPADTRTLLFSYLFDLLPSADSCIRGFSLSVVGCSYCRDPQTFFVRSVCWNPASEIVAIK